MSSVVGMNPGRQLLTSKQVADILRRDRSTIVRQARRSEIPVAASQTDARGDSFLFDAAAIREIAEQEIADRVRALEIIKPFAGTHQHRGEVA